jgi:hypothetical protein
MTMHKRMGKVAALALSLSVVAGAAQSAQATVYSYTIDPQQSSLTITGELTGNFASQQTPGSLTTSYSGTIVADVGGGKIGFNGGSSIVAALQPSNQEPDADALPGDAPANYGRSSSGPSGTPSVEAIRDLTLDMLDDTFGDGIVMTAGNFPSSSLVPKLAQANSDVLYGNYQVETDLSGKTTSNSSAGGLSSLEQVGQTETLTLKISSGPVLYNVDPLSQFDDSSISFTGTLVATRTVVPEPASAATLLGISAVGFIRRRRRR